MVFLDTSSPPFPATIDLNELKAGVIRLIDAYLSAGRKMKYNLNQRVTVLGPAGGQRRSAVVVAIRVYDTQLPSTYEVELPDGASIQVREEELRPVSDYANGDGEGSA